jgi:hypothetical protein
MNKNLTIYMLLLFMALSVWLSIKTKKAYDQIEISQASQKAILDDYLALQYRLDILQEAFQLNFKMNPEPLLTGGPISEKQNINSMILHSKPYACSPCNMPAINSLIRKFGQYKEFYVFSHTSNRYFLSEIIDVLERDDAVIWLDTNLYNHADDGYDAELLFLNGGKLITGQMPLELLKENYIFNLVLQGFSGLDDY